MPRFPRLLVVAVLVALTGCDGGDVLDEAPTTAPATAPAAAADLEPSAAAPLSVRDGIGNFAGKLRAGQPVTIAFLGGPITAGGGVRGYAPLVAKALATKFPEVPIRTINAGLVDGGSPLGAARYERDVVPHKPDLLFVEFAADDAGKEDRTWHVERLVHKAWTADPSLDVVFVYAIEESQRVDYAAGRLPPSTATHERVAARYGVPSVCMGLELLARVEAGKARLGDYIYDGWRPTPAGHAAYADAAAAATLALIADEGSRQPRKHELPPSASGDLLLRPTSRPAVPMPAPKPMTDDAGNAAKATYPMPIVGVHWVGAPEYADETGRVLWRLLTQPASENGRRLSADFGLDRTKWGPPMQWFEEWRYFTGPSGVYLVLSTPAGRPNDISARENDLPIVTFTAPQAGRYVLRVKAASVTLWGLHGALAMNVSHFRKGEPRGGSVAFHRTQRGIIEPPDVNAELRLAEGDEVAFQLDTNATGGGGGAVLRETEIVLGWFGE
jgi:lysophospholipase L1-like esterase